MFTRILMLAAATAATTGCSRTQEKGQPTPQTQKHPKAPAG